jgi:HD superfamily phosphodiesterase
VARQARRVGLVSNPPDVDALVAAAWLHDIGYAKALRATGCHALDGARYLRANRWPDRVCCLVAYHSGARFIAEVLGLGPALAEFREETGIVADVLTYADQTTGPHGQEMAVDHRMADMLERHGPDSVQAFVQPIRGPYLRSVVDRVEDALRRGLRF